MTNSVSLPVNSVKADHTLLQSLDQPLQLEISNGPLQECTIERTTVCDMVHGSGNCFGYQTASSDEGDRLVTKYSGVILPDTSVDKKPTDLVIRGTWVVIEGVGKFANFHGGGTYKGRFTTDNTYTLERSGEIDRCPSSAPNNSER